jgi:hypothetical protein
VVAYILAMSVFSWKSSKDIVVVWLSLCGYNQFTLCYPISVLFFMEIGGVSTYCDFIKEKTVKGFCTKDKRGKKNNRESKS